MINTSLLFLCVFLNTSFLWSQGNRTDHSTYYHQKKSHFENLPNDKNEIIFIGDSITDGCEWSEAFGNKKIKNRGISGDVTRGVLDRLMEITESKPSKVFLMIGVNDLARGITTDSIIKNISQIVVGINTASPQTIIYVQSILPVNDYYGKFSGHTSKGKEVTVINQALQKGIKGNYEYIDLHTSFMDENLKLDISLSNDGVHLTGEGYQRWTSLIKKYVH